MKTSIALAITLASISTTALAETPAAPAQQPAQAAGVPAMGGDMPMGKHMRSEMRGQYMKDRMERMWKEMDSNADNSISKEESTAFGNKKFDEKDGNKDGKVTREEWDAFHTAKMEEMKAKRQDRQAKIPTGEMHTNMPMIDKKPEVPVAAPAAPEPKK